MVVSGAMLGLGFSHLPGGWARPGWTLLGWQRRVEGEACSVRLKGAAPGDPPGLRAFLRPWLLPTPAYSRFRPCWDLFGCGKRSFASVLRTGQNNTLVPLCCKCAPASSEGLCGSNWVVEPCKENPKTWLGAKPRMHGGQFS